MYVLWITNYIVSNHQTLEKVYQLVRDELHIESNLVLGCIE
jgi:hypothetical protein